MERLAWVKVREYRSKDKGWIAVAVDQEKETALQVGKEINRALADVPFAAWCDFEVSGGTPKHLHSILTQGFLVSGVDTRGKAKILQLTLAYCPEAFLHRDADGKMIPLWTKEQESALKILLVNPEDSAVSDWLKQKRAEKPPKAKK